MEGGAIRKGLWQLDSTGDVRGLVMPAHVTEGWVNAGVYVFDRAMVRSWPGGSYSLEDRLSSLLQGRRGTLFCSPARLLDIGTPACYQHASESMEATTLAGRSAG